MTFNGLFAVRHRNPLGVKLKILQAKKIYGLVHDELGKEARVLEIGPGDGYIAKIASDSNVYYKGIEASPAISKQLGASGYEIEQASVPPLPLASSKYDVCFMLHIIEHLADIDSASVLLEQVRGGLKSHGKLVIATPDYARWKIDFYDCDYTHSLPFTKRRLTQLLVNKGFTIRYSNVYVGFVFNFLALPLSWLTRRFYVRFLDDLFSPLLKLDLWYRGYLTFLPSLIVVAEKE